MKAKNGSNHLKTAFSLSNTLIEHMLVFDICCIPTSYVQNANNRKNSGLSLSFIRWGSVIKVKYC